MMDFDVIDDGWQEEELDKMNEGKEGASLYRYPDSFVQLLWYMRACLLPSSF
jgi:hypothetical protein